MASTIDPNAAAAAGSGLFGLDVAPADAGVHVIPVSLDATTSYRKGAALGPRAVLAASRQVDLLDLETGSPWKAGIALLDEDPRIAAWNAEATRLAEPIIRLGGEIGDEPELLAGLERVNEIGELVNESVEGATEAVLAAGKLPVVLGGDHAVPLGAWRAAGSRLGSFGLLHFDAHADLRRAYEGFVWSHASILFNGLAHVAAIERVVQVGVRDLCDEEQERIRTDTRIATLYDREWARAKLEGRDLIALVRERLRALPDQVWITFDVDGLAPALCPNTGTPVPGGLDWHEASLWLGELARSGRRVVGIDLVEVAPEIGSRPLGQGLDEIVGARLLYRLIGTALQTR